jgi:hypothetical protein
MYRYLFLILDIEHMKELQVENDGDKKMNIGMTFLSSFLERRHTIRAELLWFFKRFRD